MHDCTGAPMIWAQAMTLCAVQQPTMQNCSLHSYVTIESSLISTHGSQHRSGTRSSCFCSGRHAHNAAPLALHNGSAVVDLRRILLLAAVPLAACLLLVKLHEER